MLGVSLVTSTWLVTGFTIVTRFVTGFLVWFLVVYWFGSTHNTSTVVIHRLSPRYCLWRIVGGHFFCCHGNKPIKQGTGGLKQVTTGRSVRVDGGSWLRGGGLIGWHGDILDRCWRFVLVVIDTGPRWEASWWRCVRSCQALANKARPAAAGCCDWCNFDIFLNSFSGGRA